MLFEGRARRIENLLGAGRWNPSWEVGGLGVSSLLRAIAASIVVLLLAPGLAGATPVAKTKDEWQTYGRVFLEPSQSVDYIQFATEFTPAMELMEELYPRYLEFTSIQDELHDPNAVSVGQDGFPAWHKRDTGDGLPLQLAILTDKKVPDRNKQYVFLTNGHAAEPCGREGGLRFFEDLLIWRTTEPDHVLADETGLTGETHEVTVKQLLERTKIYFVNTTPDGWSAGETDGDPGLYSQYNGAGFNSNRLTYHDGWVFPDLPALYKNGYSTLTQPEGAAIVKYFMRVRRQELHGRPFAAAADMHGPVPVGAVLLEDEGNDPVKLERVHDFAERIKQAMEAALAKYITPQGASLYQLLMFQAGKVRDSVLDIYGQRVGPVTEKAAFLTLMWAEYATNWEHIDYTVTGTWGGWAASDSGLDADSITYEVDCLSYSTYNPALAQLFVDNIRAILETTAVHAASIRESTPDRRSLGTRVGFYEPGHRVTDRDGNPSAPPPGPRNPIWGPIRQAHYNLSNTDYFRDLRSLITSPILEVKPSNLDQSLRKLDSFVVADTTLRDTSSLLSFAKGGGTLVLTDSALAMLPRLLGINPDSIQERFAYVGYSDLDRTKPLTEGLYDRARQMYAPGGIGYPLLMERDQYWPCGQTGSCRESPTQNSAPIWTIARSDWEDAGGETIGTADPPEDRHGGAEGFATDKVNIGMLPIGEGRIVIFGALLPRPTEEYPHWFGLNPYTISINGQILLLRVLSN